MARRRTLASRLRARLRQLLAFLFSNVGVVVLLVAYTVAGAFMFQAIEGASEMERVNSMARERNNTASYLWQNTLALNLFNETELRDRIGAAMLQYQKKIVVAVKKGWDGGRSSRQWSFSSAFLYSLTVITTIGYGHLSPRTNWGKVMTIFYALLGMPLFLLYLSNVGELLARWFKCIYALVCLCRGCPGFTRRRVVRIQPQIELSEAESIERPQTWRNRYDDSDTSDYRITPVPQQHSYRRSDRPVPVHQSPRDWPTQRIWPRPRLYPHDRYWPDPRFHPDQRHWSGSRPWPDQRTWPGHRPWHDPRGPVHGPWPESGYREDSQTSEFSYVTFDAQTITVPISVCVCIMVGYLLFGSMLFGMWEKWDQLDCAYFCFISLSSIGFGDFVPGERVFTPRIETSFIACSLYLMLGMALVAMCFNLMQEQVIHYVAAIKRALKRICRCKR